MSIIYLLCCAIFWQFVLVRSYEPCCDQGALIYYPNGTLKCGVGVFPDTVNIEEKHLTINLSMAMNLKKTLDITDPGILCEDFLFDVGRKQVSRYLVHWKKKTETKGVEVDQFEFRFPLRRCCRVKEFYRTKDRRCFPQKELNFALVDSFQKYFRTGPTVPDCENLVDYQVEVADIFFKNDTLHFRSFAQYRYENHRISLTSLNYCIQPASMYNQFYVIRSCEEDFSCTEPLCVSKCSDKKSQIGKLRFFSPVNLNSTKMSTVARTIAAAEDSDHEISLMCRRGPEKLNRAWQITPTGELYDNKYRDVYEANEYCLEAVKIEEKKTMLQAYICGKSGKNRLITPVYLILLMLLFSRKLINPFSLFV